MKRKKLIVKIVGIIAVLVIASETIVDFSFQLQDGLQRETYRTLSENSQDYNKAFSDCIDYNIKTMKIIASRLGEGKSSTKQDVMQVLHTAVNEGGFQALVVCDEDGNSCSDRGLAGNVSHRSYFQQAMKGASIVSEPLESMVSGKESMVMAVPVGTGAHITGVLFGVYPLSVGENKLLDFTYYSDGYGLIVTKEGTIILASDHEDKLSHEKNLFAFLEHTHLIDFSEKELKKAMLHGESSQFALTYEGQKRFVSFEPTGVNDWYTFSLSSDTMLQQHEKEVKRIVMELIGRVLAVIILLFVCMMWSNRRHNEEMRMANQKYESLLNHINGGMVVAVHGQTAEETLIRYVSTGFTTMTGYTLEDIQTLYHGRYLDVIDEEERKVVFQQYLDQMTTGNTYQIPYRIRKKDGSILWVMDNGYLVEDLDGWHNHSVLTDITELKRQEELLKSKVATDPMTGLYNKVAMNVHATNALAEQGRYGLIVLDIDNFKGINDTLGHAFGDVVLIDVSTKLKTLFQKDDVVVARMGGDEFAILMKRVPDASYVLKKAMELSGVFRQTYVGEKEEYKISCSMGIIMLEDSRESFESLYRKADAALYQAKKNGKDQFVLYQEKDADSYPIESTRTQDDERQNLKTSYSLESRIFELMYTAQDFDVSIHMALAAIGQQYHVSRVAVFENDGDGLTIRNIYEWCNEGIRPTIDGLQNVEIIKGTESIFDCFDETGLLYCNDVGELPPYLRRILESKGVLSALKVTISNEKKTCGFIGFDECNEHRIWTAEEIEKLSFLSKVLSVFLFKKRTEVALIDNLHTRLKILDVLPDYICVVNPETHVLEYTNRKMQELLPSARSGAFCFTTLRGGQEQPCETCLLEKIKQGNTENLEMISEDGRVHLKVNAISIHWIQDQTMVLLYGGEEHGC